MYPISSLEMISTSRCMVHLDGGDSFPLYKKELALYGISVGAEISPEIYHEITEVLLPKRACQRAMHLLQKMDRTEYQLRKKLQESGYPLQIIDHAIDYVKGFHYIDDVRYAWNYIDFRKHDQSRRQIMMALQEKGISDTDIQAALDETDFPDEIDQIQKWKEKKHYCSETADLREKQKFYQFLLRKGYSASSIRKVL